MTKREFLRFQFLPENNCRFRETPGWRLLGGTSLWFLTIIGTVTVKLDHWLRQDSSITGCAHHTHSNFLNRCLFYVPVSLPTGALCRSRWNSLSPHHISKSQTPGNQIKSTLPSQFCQSIFCAPSVDSAALALTAQNCPSIDV